MENNTLFVYGILKRGYELDLTKEGCEFISEATIPGARLYGIGRYSYSHERSFHGVGLRLDVGPSGVDDAKGELFKVPDKLWDWLDSIESNGYTYTRSLVKVIEAPNPENRYYTSAWVYGHTYPGFRYDESNLIKGGRF